MHVFYRRSRASRLEAYTWAHNSQSSSWKGACCCICDADPGWQVGYGVWLLTTRGDERKVERASEQNDEFRLMRHSINLTAWHPRVLCGRQSIYTRRDAFSVFSPTPRSIVSRNGPDEPRASILHTRCWHRHILLNCDCASCLSPSSHSN